MQASDAPRKHGSKMYGTHSSGAGASASSSSTAAGQKLTFQATSLSHIESHTGPFLRSRTAAGLRSC